LDLLFLFAPIFVIVFGWTLYNLPVLAVGLVRSRSPRGRETQVRSLKEMPSFSVVVPLRNEEKVVSRLLEALVRMDYPSDKVEVVLVEDGSIDGTAEICEEYERRYCGRVRLLRKEQSSGKPSALNYALPFLRGDIVAVFDADSVPEKDVLSSVVPYFDDSSVAAVQGRNLSINSETNMLTKFVSHEEAVWFEAYLRGKDALNLFVHLKGSCQFVRREVLEGLGGWDGHSLSEDIEISAKLTAKGYRIRYASDVRSWQESTETIGQMFGQRARWFRGWMETAYKYGKLLRDPSIRNFDAEATLFGPFIIILSLLSYVFPFFTFPNIVFHSLFTLAGWSITTATVFTIGLGLVFVSKPVRRRNLLWLPFIYAYWCFQAFIAAYALLQGILRRPRRWTKTEKNGAANGNYVD